MTQERNQAEVENTQEPNPRLSQEWLEVNGLGGYSSSTVENCHSRKYHGLLVVSSPESADRYNLLSKFDEELILEDEAETYLLNSHYYLPDVYVANLENNNAILDFDASNHPKWTYQIKDLKITKELLMPQGRNAVLLKFTIHSKKKRKIKFKFRPLLAFRNFHHLSKENNVFNFAYQEVDGGICLRPYSHLPELLLETSCQSEFQASTCWYRNFAYSQEQERGYDFTEDLASPGYFIIESNGNQSFYLSASAEVQLMDIEAVWSEELQRRKRLIDKSHIKNKNNNFIKALEKSASDFIVRTPDNNLMVIAGYHWFGSWGRDTMISLPGLFMETCYQDDFKKVIRHFLNFEKNGLIPNMIGTSKNDSAYNSVDASLWLFWAVQQFAYRLKKYDWIKQEFWSELKNIFEAYASSNGSLLQCHSNGLLYSGSETESLSWMDACLDGKSVIPRYGYLVEINALWFNAICFMEELALKFKDPIASKAQELKTRVQESFTATFYNEEIGYLADYVRNGTQNLQLRPNQLLATSLPYSAVNDEIGVKILTVAIEQLFTPLGLRTLSPRDPDYQGTYSGDTHSRDRAYHNGTVWPWLLGPLGDTLLKLNHDKNKAKKQIRSMLESFADTMHEAGLGSISEIYDGDFPHTPRGCIAQAWSVAEVRRLLIKSS